MKPQFSETRLDGRFRVQGAGAWERIPTSLYFTERMIFFKGEEADLKKSGREIDFDKISRRFF